MRNSQEVEDFNLFTSPLSHPVFQKGDSMNLEELKRLYEFRDQAYMDGVAWRDAIAAAFPAILAKLEAADRFSNEVESEVTSFLGYGDDGVVGDANVVRAVQIMRTKLKAAQRLRDATSVYLEHMTEMNMLECGAALAAFDKEQQ